MDRMALQKQIFHEVQKFFLELDPDRSVLATHTHKKKINVGRLKKNFLKTQSNFSKKVGCTYFYPNLNSQLNFQGKKYITIILKVNWIHIRLERSDSRIQIHANAWAWLTEEI